eukprot:g12810.t1
MQFCAVSINSATVKHETAVYVRCRVDKVERRLLKSPAKAFKGFVIRIDTQAVRRQWGALMNFWGWNRIYIMGRIFLEWVVVILVVVNVIQIGLVATKANMACSLLPLSTSGAKIVDRLGNRVKLRCVNWSGAQLQQYVVGGLNVQKLDNIILAIHNLHFNCVRLVYSLDFAAEVRARDADHDNHNLPVLPDAEEALAANKELLYSGASELPSFDEHDGAEAESAWSSRARGRAGRGNKLSSTEAPPLKHPSKYLLHPYHELFKLVVQKLGEQKLLVILNNHMSDAGWCCSAYDGNGLWWTRSYSEEQWIEHLVNITAEFSLANPYVVGVDLRNEIRPAYISPIADNEAAGDSSRTDWAPAALKAGLAVHETNPDLLIIVGGVYYNMFLCDVPKFPVHEFISPNQNKVIARVLRIYATSLVSLLFVAWGLFLLFAVVQRKFPQASLTRFVADWVLRDGSGQCWDVEKTSPPPHSSSPLASFEDLLLPPSPLLLPEIAIGTEKPLSARPVVCGRDGASPVNSTRARPASEPPLRPLLSASEAFQFFVTPVRSRFSFVFAVSFSVVYAVFTYVETELQKYEYLEQEYDENWGFLVKQNIAPVWPLTIAGPAITSWFKHFLRYVEANDLDWGYWPIDGQNRLTNPEPFGILDYDYTRVSTTDPEKIFMLAPGLNATEMTNATSGEVFVPGFGADSYPEIGAEGEL